MKLIAVTLRRDCDNAQKEIRDSLDRRWTDFLAKAGLTPLLIPNQMETLEALLRLPIQGVLLTGGGDLAKYGGQFVERDAVEKRLLEIAAKKKWPVFGVCRGMQAIQAHYGVGLRRIEGHVGKPHGVQTAEGKTVYVNSYHAWGTTDTTEELRVLARAEDKIVESVRHATLPISAVMWHPERNDPFNEEDVRLFGSFFHD